jgi:uncharacterized protein YciI
MIFVFVYTPGSAWIQGKRAVEQPFFEEHVCYMQRLFDDKRLLMGGPFLDHESGLGILEVENFAQARELIEQDPAVREKVFQSHLHSWNPAFNQYA